MPVNETFPSDVIALGDAGTESCMDQQGVREEAPPGTKNYKITTNSGPSGTISWTAMNVDQADAAASNVSALPRNKKTRRGKTLASQPTAQEAAKKRQVPKPNGKLGESENKKTYFILQCCSLLRLNQQINILQVLLELAPQHRR